MPGFIINGSGGPDQPPNTIETKRKHRWVFESIADTPMESNILLLLKSATRPHFTLEEPQLHHNQEVAYFAGKQTWETITLTWYDGEQDPDVSRAAFEWVQSIVDLQSIQVNPPAEYKKTGNLLMLDGTGQPIERWQIFGIWPKEVNWGDLDYSDTEIMTFEVIFRYDRAFLAQ